MSEAGHVDYVREEPPPACYPALLSEPLAVSRKTEGPTRPCTTLSAIMYAIVDNATRMEKKYDVAREDDRDVNMGEKGSRTVPTMNGMFLRCKYAKSNKPPVNK